MIPPSELLFVRVEASSALRSALEKLLLIRGSSALTAEERFEIVALNLQIELARWHKNHRTVRAYTANALAD